MMRAVMFLRVAIAGMLLVLPSTAWCQMYRWEDESGTVYFSNGQDRAPEPERAEPDPSSLRPRAPVTAPADTASRGAPVAPAVSPLVNVQPVTRIQYGAGGPILVEARISDATAPVTLILDTGADRTVISPQALWRLGVSTANAPRALIKGVTGFSQADVVQVASVQVGDARVGPLQIVAHDAELKQADGLLGRDFLEHFTVTIDAREQVVTLYPK